MVQTEQFQDRGVQVVDMDAVFHGTETEFVRGPDDLASLDAAAGQPGGEAVGIVIAAGALVGVAAVCNRRSAELAAPNHERVV